MRKLGEATEFVYGLGISSLQPANREDYNEDTPLRFVSVQLQLPDSSKTLDVGQCTIRLAFLAHWGHATFNVALKLVATLET